MVKIVLFIKSRLCGLYFQLVLLKNTTNCNFKASVYRILCEYGLVYIGEMGRNLKKKLKEHKGCCLSAKFDKSAASVRRSNTTVSSGKNLHSSS